MTADRAARRPNEVQRTLAEESWKPLACADVTPLRRFFDLQAGTIWSDLAAELRTCAGLTVLDVGCGAQPYRPLLPTSATYVGIDIEDAPRMFGYSAPDTRYYDGGTWPVEDGSVDVVLATETLEHVRDPQHFLDEARRVLRPHGRLILTVPFAARWHFIPADYWRFTPSGLAQLLGAAGFEELDVRGRGNALTVACYKVMAVCTPFIMPQTASRSRALLYKLVGALLVIPFVSAAALGNVSLRAGSGDDCLGYTAHARKPSA